MAIVGYKIAIADSHRDLATQVKKIAAEVKEGQNYRTYGPAQFIDKTRQYMQVMVAGELGNGSEQTPLTAYGVIVDGDPDSLERKVLALNAIDNITLGPTIYDYALRQFVVSWSNGVALSGMTEAMLAAAGAVTQVNGHDPVDGSVVLNYNDVGAPPATRMVGLADLTEDRSLTDIGACPLVRVVGLADLSADRTLDDIGATPQTRVLGLADLSADRTVEEIGAVPLTRTVGLVDLAADRSLTDIGAVPLTRTINGYDLTADRALTYTDVGAVPTTRTVNAKPLSADVVLTGEDTLLTGYTTVFGATTAGALLDGDTILQALARLEKRIIYLETP